MRLPLKDSKSNSTILRVRVRAAVPALFDSESHNDRATPSHVAVSNRSSFLSDGIQVEVEVKRPLSHHRSGKSTYTISLPPTSLADSIRTSISKSSSDSTAESAMPAILASQSNPAVFQVDFVSVSPIAMIGDYYNILIISYLLLPQFIASQRPEGRGPGYWKKLRNYVRLTKIAQTHERLTIKMEADDVPSDDQGIEAASLPARMQEHAGMMIDDVPPVDQAAVDAVNDDSALDSAGEDDSSDSDQASNDSVSNSDEKPDGAEAEASDCNEDPSSSDSEDDNASSMDDNLDDTNADVSGSFM
jgi:hypothetical protein